MRVIEPDAINKSAAEGILKWDNPVRQAQHEVELSKFLAGRIMLEGELSVLEV